MREADPVLTGRAAHTLKSNGYTFGAVALGDLCRELETAARDGDLSGAAPLVEQVEAESEQKLSARARLVARGAALKKTPDTGSILVVDDDRVNRTLLARTPGALRSHRDDRGERPRSAERPSPDAVPDVVLFDIMMPEMNGYEVLEHLKADAELRHLPVIMISAVGDVDSVVRCIELGAEDYLPKPFDASCCARGSARASSKRPPCTSWSGRACATCSRGSCRRRWSTRCSSRPTAMPRLGGETIFGTVLFSDLRGFTTFAESRLGHSHRPAEPYLSEISDAVLENGGTLSPTRATGCWPCSARPIASEDHADRALATARDMV